MEDALRKIHLDEIGIEMPLTNEDFKASEYSGAVRCYYRKGFMLRV